MTEEEFYSNLKAFCVQALKTYVFILAIIYLKSLSAGQENLEAYQELIRLKVIPVKPPVVISYS